MILSYISWYPWKNVRQGIYASTKPSMPSTYLLVAIRILGKYGM